MFKVTSRWPHQNSIKVEWNLGKRCNYDCSYCPAVIHDNTSPHTNVEIIKQSINKLLDIGKPIRLSFTGGEPTVHPKFEEILQHAKNNKIEWVSVTTNGTRPYIWYLQQDINQFVFSLHFEYDWRKVLKTIIEVKKFRTVVVHVMAHQDKMKDVREAVDVLQQHGVHHIIRRVRWTEGDHDLFDDMKYDQNDLDWIKGYEAKTQPNTVIDDEHKYHANDIIKLHLNKFKGWTCNVGLESLMINWDGEVHRATCRVGGSLGNIYNGTFDIPKEPITCTREFCTCAADIPITKFAISP